MKKIIFIVLLLLTTEAFPQSSFRKRVEIPYLGGDGFNWSLDHGPKMKSCIDGGYVLAGLIATWGDLDTCFIIKLDSSGTIEWKKKFKATGYYGERVNILSTPDSGFYFGMQTNDGFVGTFAYADLMKLDKFGNIVVQKVSPDPFGYFEGESMNFIEVEKDSGNLIVIGDHYYDDGNQNPCCDSLYFRKFDASLNVLFSKKIKFGSSGQYVTAAEKIYNSGTASGYLVAGLQFPNPYKTTLIKFDNNTQLLWRMAYSIANNNYPFIMDILQNDSTFYILESSAIRKIDYYGNTIFYKILDTAVTNKYTCNTIAWGNNSDLLIAGLYRTSLFNQPLMINMDMNGNIIQAKIGTDSSYFFADIDTLTKGFLFVRQTDLDLPNAAIEFERQFIDSNSCNFIPLSITSGNGFIQESIVTQTTHTFNPPFYPVSIATSTFAVVPTILCSSVGIDIVAEESNEPNLFPNPSSGSFNISINLETAQGVEIYLYNTLGTPVYFSKEKTAAGKFEKEINVENLVNGIYFLELKTKEGVLNKKVVVQH